MTEENGELIGRVRSLIERPDGSQVKIEATRCFDISFRAYDHVEVFRRQTPLHPWTFCDNLPALGFKSMPRAEYLERGRSLLWRTVTFAEVVKVAQMLGKPMSSLGPRDEVDAASAIAAQAMAAAPIDWPAFEADSAAGGVDGAELAAGGVDDDTSEPVPDRPRGG